MKKNGEVSGALINSIGTVSVFFAQWVISVLIVRITGYADAGIFSLAMSISNIFLYIANYNIRNFQISDAKQEYTQNQYLLSRFLSVAISFVACFVYMAVVGGYTEIEKVAILMYLFYSNSTMISDVMMGTVQINGHIEKGGYSNILRGIVCLLTYLGVYILTKSLVSALLVMSIGSVLVVIFYDIPQYRKYYKKSEFGFSTDFKKAVSILKNCFLLMLSGMSALIITAAPRRQIQLQLGQEQLGYFSSIFTPTVIIITLIPALILAIIPRIAEAWNKNDRKTFLKDVGKCYLLIIGFTVLALIAALFVGRFFMALLFGESILVYYDLLYWSIFATGLNGMCSCGNSVLIAMRKDKPVTIAAFISVVIISVIVENMIRAFGLYGASYALIVTYGLQALIQIIFIAVFLFRNSEKIIKP